MNNVTATVAKINLLRNRRPRLTPMHALGNVIPLNLRQPEPSLVRIRHECANMSREWRARAAACLCAAALLAAPLATAQSFPARPIRLICPQAAGGPADIFSRLVADQLSQTIGQPVVVENKTGAATMIGAEYVARAPADGYTLLMASVTTLAINPSLFPKIAYDPQKDFAPITVVTSVPMFLIVNNELRATSVPELIALAKMQPGRLIILPRVRARRRTLLRRFSPLLPASTSFISPTRALPPACRT